MSDLLEKEKRAIKLLRTVAKTTDGEIFCSTPCCGAWALIDEEYENRISKR